MSSDATAMYYRVPRPPLDAFISSIWLFRAAPRPHALERILPTGAAQLIVNLKEDRTRLYDPERPDRCVSTAGTILAGVQSCYQIIDTSEQEYVAGVAFRPGGTAAFLRSPAYETRDIDTPLDSLWGRQRTADLREQLLERSDPNTQLDAIETALRQRLLPSGVHPAVVFALTAFDRNPLTTKIGVVTDAIGMSAKRFIERFKAQVGVSPKRIVEFDASSAPLRRRIEEPRSTGRKSPWIADTATRHISFTSFDRFRVLRRPPTRHFGRHFRTTSNFYNPARLPFETIALWQTSKTRIEPSHPILWSPTPTSN